VRITLTLSHHVVNLTETGGQRSVNHTLNDFYYVFRPASWVY
jgi:hypothetical protein